MEHKASAKGSGLVLLLIIGILALGILYYEAAPHIPILLGAMVVTLYGFKLGYTWGDMEKDLVKGISHGIPAILILSLIGTLIGVWVLNGTVQTITYYGLQLLSPSTFLVSTVIITAVVAIMTGSSLSAIGTIGVSLIGVAYGMDVSPAMTAGAIVSGAIFGDKLSPLSDTTNLAAATAKTNIFEHIRHMLWTTIPALIIALIIFGVIGLVTHESAADTSQIDEMMQVMQSEFPISIVTLLSPLVIIGLAVKRFKPIPSLSLGLIVAALTTFYTMPGSNLGDIMGAAHFGYDAETGHEAIDELLTLGGLDSMLFGVSLIIIALAFGGLIQGIGIAAALIEGMKNALRSRGNTIASTLASCLGVNIVTGEQYLSIILPGQMYEEAYRSHHLHPKNLSRTIEDGGTILHPLIPWGVIGAFVMTTLNVGMEYVFFVFLSLVTPFIALFYAYTGWTLTKSEETQEDSSKPNDASKNM
ncbi:NhaC family Na+:H+ antiporter [Geomicrobium halophilum]|uniref:NhaC family Na+:H+ antiporter n=1 Tax=Geomicrobium halophilum TaxID=549000 RepID=A0A841Q157_9BACL|nr:Na+/H+ antiporter NhaC [Geomicrobium halophilum]MBB6451325.1 NhaC family Na+:H+ antiporter [Geomicrobium halophilum]